MNIFKSDPVQCMPFLFVGFASATDNDNLEIVAAVQTRSLLCTVLSIVTRGDLQHFDVAISVVEQLYDVSTGDVISHNKCVKLLTGLKVSVRLR